MAGLFSAAPALIAAAPAAAVPGTPGVPQANSVVYEENFENVAGNAPVGLAEYEGVDGQQYTAAAAWLSNCNGQIVNYGIPYSTQGNCANAGSSAALRQLAWAMGSYDGTGATTNNVVAAYTEGAPGADLIEFATVGNIPLASSTGRFLTFSVDAAAMNCPPFASAPSYQFALVDDDGAATNVGGVIDACTASETFQAPTVGPMAARPVAVGTYTSNGSVLFNGESVGISMTNTNGSGAGNDAAFDNIRILDVTPQLDKVFSPDSIVVGKTSTLTFTVTNTEELAAKNGWSFTDELPEGLTVATPNGVITTCPAGTVTAPAGGTTITAGGNLAAGMESCTLSVDVTGSATGTYMNGPDNVTSNGLNEPGETPLTITDPELWSCTASGYLFQTPSAGVHQMFQVDLVTGDVLRVGTTDINVNAVGYNTLDDYMYGWAEVTQSLVRIGADGTTVDLGRPDGAANVRYQVGDFDDAGHLYLQFGGGQNGDWIAIDLAPGSATYGQVVDSGAVTRPAGISNLPSDWTFVDGALYGIGNTPPGSDQSRLLQLDTATGAYTDLGPVANTVHNGTYGAAYADAAGNAYFSNNDTGEILRVNPVTLESIVVSDGPISRSNDGARCADAPIPTVTVTKNVDGRAVAGDQFTVGLSNASGAQLASATTTGTGTTVSTTDWPVSQGATYTVTDAMAAGSPNGLEAYSASVLCTDAAGNAVPTEGDTGAWTFTVADATAYTCEVTNAALAPAYTVSKTASADTANPGDVVTYTVTATNTSLSDYTDENPASFADDLSAVIDDATYNDDATEGATVTDGTLAWEGPLAAGASITITYSVTVNSPNSGDGVLTNAVVPTGPGGGCVPDECTTTTDVESYTVSKTSSATSVLPGDVVTYAITVTNTGTIDFTDDHEASLTDDLAAVLDDATYNDDATQGATVTGSTLTWAGALPAGESITITYSVTVNTPNTGDNVLTNAVVPTGPGGSCDPAGECTTSTNVQSFSVVKTADANDVVPGDVISYTLTVTNTGQTAYTAENPATLSDDLSAVLDDATYNDDATDGATYVAPVLSWEGALAVGEVVTITYTVTVNDPATGDNRLTNAVVTENGGSCPAGSDDPACVVNIPQGAFTVAKTSSAATVNPGDVVTYSVTVTNTGEIDFTEEEPASFADDLSAVLDDATYNDDATNGAEVGGTELTWEGPLAIGATVTITYSVTVDTPGTGDDVLTNTVRPTSPGGVCDPAGECATTTDVQSYAVAKAASPEGTANLGDVVTYSITVTNTGSVDYTDEAPASLTDDLSAVLDDATYNDDATNGAEVTDGVLTWEGALAAGATVTITYSVTVNATNTGDGVLTNAVVPDGPGGDCLPGECETSTEIESYSVSKSSSATTAEPGDTITYTLTVTNTGATDYTDDAPATLTDDLSAVLDDATYNDDATNGAEVTAGVLTWEGALAAGATVTITYSVTVNAPNTGDGVLTNAVVPDGPGGDCLPGECETTTNVQSYTVAKSAGPVGTVNPGDVVTYTVTVTNTGSVAYPADAGASLTDDLSAVLDDATYNDDATEGATVTGGTLAWSGALAAGATVTITYSVTVNAPNTGDGVLTNAVVPTGPGGSCDPAGECTTTTDVQSYTVSKTSSATSVNPGETVTYSVTVTNTGSTDYTDDAPATFTDDLSAVLDDATYNDDATNGAEVTGGVLTWEGALPAGESITITYSVTVNSPNTGDNVLTNAVLPTGPGGSCDPAGECTTTTEVQSYSVTKSADAVDVVPGDTVTYTLAVANTGQTAYTADAPATITDDLSAVLDDAEYNDDATNGATYAAPVLSWEGPLAIGETVVITYSVTVNDPATGDQQLDNAVLTGAGGNCPPGSTDAACIENIPSGSFSVTKQASSAEAFVGDVITYTITVANTGEVAYTDDEPASFSDNLANVLDDATYNDDASNGAEVEGTTLTWSGPLAIGETLEITYSVTVNAAGAAAGDGSLGNVVTPTTPGGECDPEGACVTETPIGSFSTAKVSSGAGTVHVGDVITYTVSVTNTGQVAFEGENLASFTDDLSAVLDDATYNDDASNGATVDGTTLSWSGALGVEETVEITYSVTVGAAGSGDGELVNAVLPGDGGVCIGECSTEDLLEAYTAAKTSSAEGTVRAGQVVTYTVTITNTGATDYTDATPATFADDLSAVLDDAEYNDDASGGATYAAPTLTWSGALPAGESIEVTYSVTVLAAGSGDGVLTNAVVPGGPGGDCETDGSCSTTDELQAFVVTKAASATAITPGATLTYTITVTNTGVAAFTDASPAVVTDDLSELLDDAEYNDDASNGAVYEAPVLSWALAIPAGGETVLTYSVTVDDPATGDLRLVNAVVPGEGGECVEGECVTDTPVASYEVAKTVSTGSTAPGQVVTYTITVTNTGAADFTDEMPATFADDLSAVLDDARYNADISAGGSYDPPVLTWAGPVSVGATATVTYSVTVNDPATGDRRMVNAVVPGLGGSCGAACQVTTDITVPGAPPLASTGVGPWLGLGMGLAGAAIIAGLALMLIRRRRNVTE